MLLTVFHIVVPPGIATIYQVVEYRFFLKTAQLSFPPAVSPSGFCFCASLQRMIRLRKVSEFLWIMDFQLPCFFITRVRDKDCVKNRVKRAKIVRFTIC